MRLFRAGHDDTESKKKRRNEQFRNDGYLGTTGTCIRIMTVGSKHTHTTWRGRLLFLFDGHHTHTASVPRP